MIIIICHLISTIISHSPHSIHLNSFQSFQGEARVLQKNPKSDEQVEVGKLGPSDYFGGWSLHRCHGELYLLINYLI